MLPWAEMARAAALAGIVGSAFWALSVREWLWLCGQGGGGIDRTALRALMSQFPDRSE